MKKALMFDLDGTLTDTKEGIVNCVRYALSHFGMEEKDEKKLERFIGPPLHKSFMEYCGFEEKKAFEAVAKYRERYKETGVFENKLYSGMKELLFDMPDKILCVATAKPQVFAEQILDMHGVKECFEVIVGSNLDGTRTEKDEVITEVLRQLPDIKREEFVMIGDRRYDITGAAKCGIESIGVLFGFPEEGELEAAGATYIVKDVQQLHMLLKKL